MVDVPEVAESSLAGRCVLVAGAGLSGIAAVRFLIRHGAIPMVADDRADLPEDLAAVPVLRGLTAPPPGIDLVLTSPGWRPTTPLLASAMAAGIEVIGDVELAWRQEVLDRPWLAVTGTNGKTTTVGMLESILLAAGMRAQAAGNVGVGVLDVVDAEPAHDVIALELSSFQLHYAPGVRPLAGAVLNLAEDHLDWHGGMAEYAAAKARALTGQIGIAVVDDANAAMMLQTCSAGRRIAVTAADPGTLDGSWDGQLGVRDGYLVDEAFGAGVLLPVAEIRPPGTHNVTNALTAAALALAAGVTADQVRVGLAKFQPGGHRNSPVATVQGVLYVDDSKATNPHAALASMRDYQHVVWVAGGQLKGAAIDELIQEVVTRLRAVVIIGVDREIIAGALARHAPDVPRLVINRTDDGVMDEVVKAAAGWAEPGDVVLLAPAAASLDMFPSYASRGQAFASAVGRRRDGSAALVETAEP